MNIRVLQIIVSALTAFVVGAGGSLVVVLGSGGTGALNKTAWILSIVMGLVVAAKDVRSLLQLPPVDLSGPNGGTK